MDILLIVILFAFSWLAGHLLDKIFTVVENLVKANKSDQPFSLKQSKPVHKVNIDNKQSARLYVVPSATVRH